MMTSSPHLLRNSCPSGCRCPHPSCLLCCFLPLPEKVDKLEGQSRVTEKRGIMGIQLCSFAVFFAVLQFFLFLKRTFTQTLFIKVC